MATREELKAVMKYHDPRGGTGGYFVGGMATAGVCRILGIVHGSIDESMDKAIDNACKHEVAELSEYLKSYLKYMRANPMKKCEKCGSIVPQ